MFNRTFRLPFITGLLTGAALLGCGAEPPESDDLADSAAALHAASGTALDAEGAFTCDFSLPGDLPLVEVPAIIERDRMFMAERPGMQHKHLPIAIDFATGNLFSGGRYLFDTEEQASDYNDWVRNDFALDGTKFLERPIFLGPDCHAWSVIGAHEFAPITTSQVVMRTERWSTPDKNQRKRLKDRWPAIVADAEARGLTAVWLLYDKQEQLASLVYYADRVTPPDPQSPDFASLFALQYAPALGDDLADLGWPKTFDRTHWVLTIWFPFAAGDQGAPSLWPHSPPLPAPFCGDGVCEPSRGESGASCGADCAAGCGDAICQAGEDDHACPSDCRL